MISKKDRWRRFIVTFGGAGESPIAPGTAGSLATAGVILLAHHLALHFGNVTSGSVALFLLAGILTAGALSVWAGPWAIAHFQRKDPGPFVLDEVAGLCLSMLFLPVRFDWRELWVVLIAFGCFRVFDVIKPPPCRLLEKLPAGWGILTDDLMAGIYANLLGQLLTRTLLHF